MSLAFAGGSALRPTSLTRPVQATAVAVGLLWLACGVMLTAPQARAAGAATATWWCMPGTSLAHPGTASAFSATLAGLPMAMVMAGAMTLPGTLPAVHHVALNSLRPRQWRAVGEFLTVYLGLWLAFISMAVLAFPLLGSSPRNVVLALALAGGALWQLSSVNLRALNRCHRSRPLPPRGPRASWGVIRFASLNASGCIGTCGPAMLAMLVAPRARLGWMVALTSVAGYEKLSRTPRKATRRAAAAYAAGAVGVTIGALLA